MYIPRISLPLSFTILDFLPNRFVLGVIVYFVAGAIIMKVRYDATGSDLIPNKSFWAALPFLVKVSGTLYYYRMRFIDCAYFSF